MADDKSKTRPQDSSRIDVNEEYELRHWSDKFRVSPERLREAVQKVGPMAKDVEEELARGVKRQRTVGQQHA